MIKQDDLVKLEKLRDIAQSVIPQGGHVWLYGSRARGEGRSDSDWDLLILLPKDNITIEDEDTIAFPFVMAGWQNDMDVNPQTYTCEEWEKRSFTPYYKNVEQEKYLIK